MSCERTPTFASAAWFWLKLGCISFGGPAAHIGLLHREVVERRRWIDERQFSHALGFCMLLPGPEAQQLVTYIGWKLHGARGGAVAGTLFVLPSAILLWVLSIIYVTSGSSPLTASFFSGLQPVVVAVVAMAAFRMARRSLSTVAARLTAASAFILILLQLAPFPTVLLASCTVGVLFPNGFFEGADPDIGPPVRARSSAGAGLLSLALWLLPVALLAVFERGIFARLAMFFSATSLLTFGGAYAILPLVAQHAVASGWMTPSEMLAGLGLAEATPGPLIIVLQFYGFITAWHEPGGLPPLLAATLGGAIATWVTFLPSFVWIFFGAPYIEIMRRNLRLAGGLAAISACVAGIVASLAVWLASQVFLSAPFRPDWFAVALFLMALAFHRGGILPIVLMGGFAGILRQLVAG